MTVKDEESELVSKTILDWITRVGALATVLAGILALFFPDESAKRLAGIGALVLAMGSAAVFLYRRTRAARLKIAESLEPLKPSAALRGLLPFEDGDDLPGRARDVQGLYTLVASSSFRFGVLWGESGCGKTSLLRAGLTPLMRKGKFLPLYIGKPTKEPRDAIRAALIREAPGLGERVDEDLQALLNEAAPSGKKIVIIFDQFEEFFLTNRTVRSRAGFARWLGEAVADEGLPVAFLVSIRADFFAQLQNLAPYVPEPTSPRSTYQLQNFDTQQAKQIFVAAAAADAIPFEPSLIEAVVSDLETEELIRPAELQIVGTRLKRKNVFKFNRYEVLGRARGILSSYIGEEIKQSANEQAARLVLRLMCADVVETKSPTDLSLEDVLRGLGGSGQAEAALEARSEVIQAILNQFAAARILIHTDDDKYNLVHDYLAPYVRTATEGLETNVERANRRLKRYVAEYKEDPRTRIPYRRLREIQKYASAEVKGVEKARELIRKSQRAFYATVGSVLAMPLVLALALYGFQASSYYLSTEAATDISTAHIVVRSGHPWLKFLPGTGQAMTQTKFTINDLDESNPGVRDEIVKEQVTGLWFQRDASGYPRWEDQIVERLSPLPQIGELQRRGQSDRALERCLHFITDPRGNPGMKVVALQALGQMAKTDRQLITREIVASVIAVIADTQADPSLRQGAVIILEQFAQADPQIVTSDVVQVLVTVIRNPVRASFLHVTVATYLKQLAQTNPSIVSQAVTSEVIQSLAAIIVDRSTGPQDRVDEAYTLGQLIQAHFPIETQAVTPEVLLALDAVITDPLANLDIGSARNIRLRAASVFGELSKINPHAVTPEVLQPLMAVVSDPETNTEVRFGAAQALGSIVQGKSQAVASGIVVQAVISIVADPTTNPWLLSMAASALEPLIQANPDVVTTTVLQPLIATITDPKANYSRLFEVAQSLKVLAQANPQVVSQAVTPAVLQAWVSVITDPQVEDYVRGDVAQALGPLVQANPRAVTPTMLQALNAVVADPQVNAYVSSSVAYSLSLLTQANPQP